jgi:hypothetical protein
MKNLIRRRPSPALVIATLALIVALGGVSYAAIKAPKNSVRTKSIKNGAVTSKKIKNGAVTAGKLAPDAITPTSVNGVLPVGFAHEDASLVFKQGNVVASNNPAQGVYCFNLSSKVNGGLATIDSNDSSLNASVSTSTEANPPCAAPFNDFRVDSFQGSTHSNQAFFLDLF